MSSIARPLFVLTALLLTGAASSHAATPYLPPPAERVTNYFATVLPCRRIDPDDDEAEVPFPTVKCKHGELENKSLRELAILRNTIYARYGWDGFRKTWLRDYFHAQPWFRPNPGFSYKLISEVDKKNAHLIAAREASFTETQLMRSYADLFARHGKVWNDRPEWTLKNGKKLRACEPPKQRNEDEDPEYQGEDCYYAKQSWYRPNPKFTVAQLSPEDRIELGLISRAAGSMVLDDGSEVRETFQESMNAGTLDKLLKLGELRRLSLRDLRLLRNTIYARRGRAFKSKILREHFTGMSWYKLRSDYSDKLLSKTDRRNISLVKSVENELGGSLSDEDWLTEPVFDMA